MPIVSTGLTLTGARSEFFQAFDQAEQHVNTLATRLTSQHPTEQYRWIGGLPQVRELGTGRLLQDVFSESYDVTSLEYELSISVDRKEFEDDQTGQIKLRIAELARVAASHPDFLIEQLLINGSSAGFLGYDGQVFFSGAHVSGDSGTQDNTIDVNVTDTANPTTAEFKLAIRQAIERMMGFKNDRGQPMRIGPTGLSVVVPPTLYFVALEALSATLVDNTSSVLKGAASVIVLPGLTAGTKFYLCKTVVPLRPFVHQVRIPIDFTAIGPGSEEEFKRSKYLYGVRGRYVVTYGEWRHAIEVKLT